MQITLGAADIQMILAAAMAGTGALSLLRRARRRGPPAPPGRAATALLAGVALAAAANYFLLGRHPTQFVKTWDVQHTWFGAKYAAELGYFRLYECLYWIDAGHQRRYADVPQLADLQRPAARVEARAALARSDCAERFGPARRAELVRDLDFFQRLPERPIAAAWFVDNGYNQSPFFTALVSPLFQRAPPSYGLFVGLALLDVALEVLPFALVAHAFGARTGLLAAVYFFTSFSNQFAVMGGSVLRFAYLALLLAAVCAAQRERPRGAGVLLGLSTLLQVFPALYAFGLALAAGHRWLRTRRLPAWALPFGLAYAATLAAGFAASLLVVAPGLWREFAAKLAVHAAVLSEYHAGLKLALVLDWPVPPGGWLAYASKLAELRELSALYAACAGALVLAAVSLAPRLRPLELAIVFATLALYVVTPVHYYFATLVLVLLVARNGDPDAWAATLVRSLLFALSAVAFLVHRASGSLALVNGYWLSLGLLFVLVAWVAILHIERRPLEAQLLEREAALGIRQTDEHVDARVALRG
jgi:hypothetical protein